MIEGVVKTALTTAQIRTLLAVLYLHSRGESLTARAVSVVEHHSPATAHQRMHQLMEAGFLTMDPGRRGTWRPTVRAVAAG